MAALSEAESQQPLREFSTGLKLFLRVADLLRSLVWVFLYLDFTVLIALLFAGVIARYIFNHAFFAEDDLGILLLLFLVFLGSGQALAAGSHPSIDFLSSRLPAIRARLQAAGFVIIGAYLMLLVYYGTQVAVSAMKEQSLTLGIPMSLPYSSVPIGSLLALIQLMAKVARTYRSGAYACAVFFMALLVFSGVWYVDHVVHLHWPNLVWLLLPTLLLANIPIAFAIGMFSMFLIATTFGASLFVAPQQLAAGVQSPGLISIPTFVLCGALLECSGMAQLLMDFFASVIGRLNGGLAIADTMASAVFADISGSAVADTAAVGSIMIPAMTRRGYDEDFATAHQAATGSLGTVLPPCTTGIILSTVTNMSVLRLYRASVIPGALLVLVFCVTAYLIATRRRYPCEARKTPTQIMRAFAVAIPAFLAPFFILGGIFAGIFTRTEIGAVAATYVFVLTVSLYRQNASFKSLRAAAHQAILRTAMVMYIIANTFILAWALATTQTAQQLSTALAAVAHDPVVVLVLSAIVVVALAIFLEPPAILIGAVPLLLPIATGTGVDPVTFGVVIMLAACIGNQIPPIGITLLVATSLGNAGIERTARQIIPYTIATAVVLLMVAAMPSLTLVLAGK